MTRATLAFAIGLALGVWAPLLPACGQRAQKGGVAREALEKERRVGGPCGKVPGLKICTNGER